MTVPYLTSPPEGLSPLTRGNLSPCFLSSRHSGPIPAHAGEPRRTWRRCSGPWAYPRSRGGTPKPPFFNATVMGLSPLTRGNPVVGGLGQLHVGPIPAHAGEPALLPSSANLFRAYPRSRGGTQTRIHRRRHPSGLSPLTRGNLSLPAALTTRLGPIPAHAGEPVIERVLLYTVRAYPRSRGGT